MTKLYHYIHCPFCVRVRMSLGYLNESYESIVLDYNDEKTPIDLTGVKMLPILTKGEFTSNESLVIINYLDNENKLKTNDFIKSDDFINFEDLLNKLGSDIHNLVMPYWAWSKEFTPEAREYFISKKSKKRGPFNELAQKKDQFLKSLDQTLKTLNLKEFHPYTEFSIKDIMLASHLWGMYVFPEFQFSVEMHNYLQDIKRLTNFKYHEDFWV